MSTSIDVVVLAYNHWELTSSCLTHLAAQSMPHVVTVVDNGSTDQTRKSLRHEWPDVAVVELSHNHPFTQAVNLGVAYGDAEFVVLLNNDVDLHPDCLEHLVGPLELDADVGSVAAVMLTPGERLIDSVGVTTDVTLAGFPRLHGLSHECAAEPHPLLTGPEGTTAAYRRAAWEQVGGLDETIRAYMEILDIAWRLRQAGWETVCAPKAVGMHHGSATFVRRSREQRHLAGLSRGYLLRRYGVMRGRFALRTLLTEAAVVVGDMLISRDAAALTGRLAGWHAARGMKRHPRPPQEAIDTTISLRDSLALRRGVYRLRA